MSIFITILFVLFIGSILLLMLSCIRLSGKISRTEEQQSKCTECKYFMICESGKQHFFAVTGAECEDFERVEK